MNALTCFKAYDIRGRLPDELNEDLALKIGRAFVDHLQARRVVVGGDMRLSTPAIKNALIRGMMIQGANVIDIGLCGTEEIYFATRHFQADGGIMVTASHNPKDYNGLKLVQKCARPISNDSGLLQIKSLVERDDFVAASTWGQCNQQDNLDMYVLTLLSIFHLFSGLHSNLLKPMKLVVNAGNGMAGKVVDKLESEFNRRHIPIEFVKLNHEPDGNFPNGVPNPLLEANRQETSQAVIEHKADMGIAWDGDFDRCFFFDEKGDFIEGYYIVGLLSKVFLEKYPESKVVHDPRLTWNTQEIVKDNGGIPVQCKTGHAFIKERMRKEDAIYGGEMSAHHYFRHFAYCDSGMLPWLIIAEVVSQSGKTLSELVSEQIEHFPCSGEINTEVSSPRAAIALIKQHYNTKLLGVDETDGLSINFGQWRFNLRASNTEPLLRLNVETKGDPKLLKDKTQELLGLIDRFEQKDVNLSEDAI